MVMERGMIETQMLTIRVPKKVHKGLKLRAIAEDTTLTGMLNRAFVDLLARPKAEEAGAGR